MPQMSLRGGAPVLCAIVVAICAGIGTADDGGVMMHYRVTQTHYGPLIRINDWQRAGGEGDIVSAGGAVQIFTGESIDVVRNDYPLPGGGDVELSLSFNFERVDAGSAATFYFNQSPAGTGFQVRIDADGVIVRHLDEVVHRAPPISMGRDAIPHLKLVTLATSWEIELDGQSLATGRLKPPYTENEGRLGVIVEDAGLRIITCEERFIVHDVDFPGWQRGELLYEERFGPGSLERNWVTNGEAPTVAGDTITWQPMSVNVLRQRFRGPIAIDCTVTPMPPEPERFTSGVTDAIFIWMIDHPEGTLFEYMRGLEDASLANYMSLPFYWIDLGGTNNQTTRFRKNPRRHLIRQFDTRPRLMRRNHTYEITIVQNRNVSEFWVDGERWIQSWDPEPLTEGHIGFRAYVAGLTLHSLRVWRIGE